MLARQSIDTNIEGEKQPVSRPRVTSDSGLTCRRCIVANLLEFLHGPVANGCHASMQSVVLSIGESDRFRFSLFDIQVGDTTSHESIHTP